MVLEEVYKQEYVYCLTHGIHIDKEGHYKTKVKFNNKPYYINEDGSDIEFYSFWTGCKKRVKHPKTNEIITLYSEKFKHFGNKYSSIEKLLEKYGVFLRCDGITDKHQIYFYMLHLLYYKFDFYEMKTKYNIVEKKHEKKWIKKTGIDFRFLKNMLYRAVKWTMSKEVSEEDRKVFRKPKKCVVNKTTHTALGGIRKKTKGEVKRDVRKAVAEVNHIRILNGDTEGYSRATIFRHTKDTKKSKKDLIIELYDETKSIRENAKLIGVDRNTLRKYLRQIELEKTEKSPVNEVEAEIAALLEEDDFLGIYKAPEQKEEPKVEDNSIAGDDNSWLDKIDLD